MSGFSRIAKLGLVAVVALLSLPADALRELQPEGECPNRVTNDQGCLDQGEDVNESNCAAKGCCWEPDNPAGVFCYTRGPATAAEPGGEGGDQGPLQAFPGQMGDDVTLPEAEVVAEQDPVLPVIDDEADEELIDEDVTTPPAAEAELDSTPAPVDDILVDDEELAEVTAAPNVTEAENETDTDAGTGDSEPVMDQIAGGIDSAINTVKEGVNSAAQEVRDFFTGGDSSSEQEESAEDADAEVAASSAEETTNGSKGDAEREAETTSDGFRFTVGFAIVASSLVSLLRI
ncbi:unnamed protein product [Vitrella brassicaformis CCMP3155]|uniref:P-type domain-containing protein n=2 Tax=Vitrella brassicaformis TaxID=1169539 RepID=A0A0G4ESW6_VITBC|nr:unnamed protein product [Vitrella brassicaformis CCMP3155]|mmetsp:Transcript_10524/g.25529  ORF Transcript_10524/g.25529 Transcript_10524/m.25529 type:complete len:289 (+) Transcript_10524:169-1035(+)|eukprot:CEM00911.1 unnamed protein product [Vitrella brassicaformis CCMP3155]